MIQKWTGNQEVGKRQREEEIYKIKQELIKPKTQTMSTITVVIFVMVGLTSLLSCDVSISHNLLTKRLAN